MFGPKTFSETIRPILLLNILLGTGSLATSKEQKVRMCVESVYMVSAWIFSNLIISAQYIYKDAAVATKLDMYFTIDFAWDFMNNVVVTVLIFVTKFKMKITQDLIEAVDKVDQEMQAIGLPSQYPIEFKNQVCHFSGWFVNVTVNLVVTLIFRMEPNAPILMKITVTLGRNIMHIMLITVQLSFTVWVGHIGMKFRQLNKLLEEMIETFEHSVPKRFLEINDRQIQNRRPPNIHAIKGNVETITKAKNCHLYLIKIARRINKFYGVQLLLTTLIWLFTIITLLYILNFCIWQTRSKVHLFYEIGPVILWLILTILRIIYLHSMCMQTSNEAGKTGFLLCRLYSSSTSVQFRSEIQHFTSQVLANPLVFNVCGLVDIDRTFLSSLVGSIFAYLIVIVQLAGPQVQQRQNITANATDLVGSIFAYLIVIVQLAGPQVQQRQNITANATDVNVTGNYT